MQFDTTAAHGLSHLNSLSSGGLFSLLVFVFNQKGVNLTFKECKLLYVLAVLELKQNYQPCLEMTKSHLMQSQQFS